MGFKGYINDSGGSWKLIFIDFRKIEINWFEKTKYEQKSIKK